MRLNRLHSKLKLRRRTRRALAALVTARPHRTCSCLGPASAASRLGRIRWQQTFTPATAALRRGTKAWGVAGNLSSGCICCTNPNANDVPTIIQKAASLIWGKHPIYKLILMITLSHNFGTIYFINFLRWSAKLVFLTFDELDMLTRMYLAQQRGNKCLSILHCVAS